MIYKISYGLGIVGYIIMMMAFFGLNFVFNHPPQIWMDVGLVWLYYGLLFGVLGRDLSEICTDKMAANIGVGQHCHYHARVRFCWCILIFVHRFAVLQTEWHANATFGGKCVCRLWQSIVGERK